MRKLLPTVLLLAGLSLLLYPRVSQHFSTVAQHRAAAAFLSGETDLLGYLTVPAIHLTLPIRQGTSETVLRDGAGLLEGTKWGEHAVLCGHRGLPESVLFRDLNKLRLGDIFSVTTAEGTATFQIDQILVISPEETDALLPEEGRQLCTLLTCTPYGINSHRLLVRGFLSDEIR